ncbi:MAG: hypothetical protein KGL39_33535, partial [Patescibacteria group bacterium]|nr:hypothetical protein [Patescibacteria group bacterium]
TAEVTNFSPPLEIVAFLACAAFALWFFLLVVRVVRLVRGDDPQPPNPQLGRDVKDLRRRVEVLEAWRQELINKLDADKLEILRQGSERAAKIYAHIEEVRRELAENQNNLPERIVALLRNAGSIK